MYQTPPTETEQPSVEPPEHVYSKELRRLIAAIGLPVNDVGYAEGHRVALLPDSYGPGIYASRLESAIHRAASALAVLPVHDAKIRIVHGLSIMLGYEEGSGR